MGVEGIDGTAARRVHAVEELRQAHEIGIVLEGPPAAAVEIGVKGRRRGEGDPVAADAILWAGLRAWKVNSEGGVFSAASTMSPPIRTRSPSTTAPARPRIWRASGSSTSMPISCNTRSDWRWMVSI
jgi:hypothetical protein